MKEDPVYEELDDDELIDHITADLDRQWTSLGYSQEELDELKRRFKDPTWRVLWVAYFRQGLHVSRAPKLN
jgi:phage-related protein